jgi:hypothetical protein
MDPFGLLSLVIDNAERIRDALAQESCCAANIGAADIRAAQIGDNLESLSRLKKDVSTSLEDLEEILANLRDNHRKNVELPSGLDRDLELIRTTYVGLHPYKAHSPKSDQTVAIGGCLGRAYATSSSRS